MSVAEHGREFDCVECGRHIIRVIHRPGELLICAECMFMPGWYTVPELRDILDPERRWWPRCRAALAAALDAYCRWTKILTLSEIGPRAREKPSK